MHTELISKAVAGIDDAYIAQSEDFAAVRAAVTRARARRKAVAVSLSALLAVVASVAAVLRVGSRRETAQATIAAVQTATVSAQHEIATAAGTARAGQTELAPDNGAAVSSPSGPVSAAGNTVPAATGVPGTTTGYSLPSAGSYGGDGTGWFNIPRLPEDRSIEVTGEALTDGEAAAYFRENLGWIAQSIGAEALRVEEKGYCHVGYDGVVGRPFELKQNFRDYLAYDGGRLAAILTLVKEDGKISCTPAFGAPWFESFDALLKKHAGQTLVFVYAGPTELAVAPDGEYFRTTGGELPRDFGFETVDDLYGLFYHERAAYTP